MEAMSERAGGLIFHVPPPYYHHRTLLHPTDSPLQLVCPYCCLPVLSMARYLDDYGVLESNWWLHDPDAALSCSFLRSLVSGARP